MTDRAARERLPPKVVVARWTSRPRRWVLQTLRQRPRLFGLVERALPDRIRPREPRGDADAAAFALRDHRPVHLPASNGLTLNLRQPSHVDAATRAAARRADVVRVPADWLAKAGSTRVLLELAASGAPVELDGRVPAGSVVDHDLGAMFEAVAEARSRALRSVIARRAALEAHRRSISGTDAPPVSVVLSTSRPAELPSAIEQIASQRAVEVQLVLGLHGDHWANETEDKVRERWTGELEIIRCPSNEPLGGVLQMLSAKATAPLISKWDDDDLYGPFHLADLERAWTYSGAEVVGKFAECVYLEDSDVTIRRASTGSETYGGPLAGGTLLMSADWLQKIGGWPRIPRRVDQELLNSTYAASGTTYRTHGFQYVLRRRQQGSRHTWAAPDAYFLDEADEVRSGLDRGMADLEDR